MKTLVKATVVACCLVVTVVLAAPGAAVRVQAWDAASDGSMERTEQAAPCQGLKAWTTAEDHQNMLGQLGIRAVRPGRSPNEKDPNAANYDEALANPFPELPDVLTLKNGRRVTTAAGWAERRKEIVEEFEREVVGRIPARVPKVTWSVAERADGTIAGIPVVGRHLVGRVDNAWCPEISVEIQFTLVTPADVKRPVPVMIMFRGGTLGQALGTAPPAGRGAFTPPPGMLGTDPPATEQLLADGWGFAFLNPASIQAEREEQCRQQHSLQCRRESSSIRLRGTTLPVRGWGSLPDALTDASPQASREAAAGCSAGRAQRNRRGANSLKQRRHVSHSWAVPGDSK